MVVMFFGIFFIFMGGLRSFWPNVYFHGLESDGDSPHLVLSWDKVYVSEKVWAYAYLYSWPATTITDDEARWVISWVFTNEVAEWFIGGQNSSGDLIIYQGHPKRIRLVMNRYGHQASTSPTVISVWVKHNNDILTGSIAWWRLSNAADYIGMVSISQAVLNSGDTIQLMIRWTRNTTVTPEMITTYASEFFN